MSTIKGNRLENLAGGDVDIQHDAGLSGDLIQDIDDSETRNKGIFMPGKEWAGPWTTTTAYVTDQVVTQGGLVYLCLTNHTSGTFATDLGSGYWEQYEFATLADVTFGRTFAASTASTINVVEADRGKVWYWTGSSACTVNLPAAASIAPPYLIVVVNNGTATITIDGNGGEQINGQATQTLVPGQAAQLFCTGVAVWYAIITEEPAAKGTDVASASALTLGIGNYFDVTGTTTITSIATKGIGTVVRLHFDDALTLTHHATDLILPGAANITTAAGDEAEFVEYATGDWRCVNYSRSVTVPGTIPAGTLMLFQQTSAPTGWTKQTTHNDKALRVVSGTASSGGSSAFSTVFGKTATDSHTLTVAQMPAHTHTVSKGATGGGDHAQNGPDAGGSIATSSTGGGDGHSHNMDIRVQYVDIIIASKD